MYASTNSTLAIFFAVGYIVKNFNGVGYNAKKSLALQATALKILSKMTFFSAVGYNAKDFLAL
jgi:hypothetical protein